jgi:predicted nuclease with TOPRIM domain
MKKGKTMKPALLHNLGICCILAFTLQQNGCTALKTLQANSVKLQSDVDSLESEIRRIKELTAYHNDLLRYVRADQQVRFDELERQIAAVAGGVSESQVRLSKIDSKTQKLKEGWDEKARADSVTGVKRLAEIESLFDIAMGDFNAGRRPIALNGF